MAVPLLPRATYIRFQPIFMSRYLKTFETERLSAHVSRQYEDDNSDCPHTIVVDFGARSLDICECCLAELLEMLTNVDSFLKEQKEAKVA